MTAQAPRAQLRHSVDRREVSSSSPVPVAPAGPALTCRLEVLPGGVLGTLRLARDVQALLDPSAP